MVHYRRARDPGATYFFTVTLRNRRSDILVEHVDVLRAAFRKCRARRSFRVDAIVVLPDHLHTIWTLPEGDADYSSRWRMIKSDFVRGLKRRGLSVRSNPKGECDVWQRRFWEHRVRDPADLSRHIDYIHINPVKHHLVTRVRDWPWSSFHRYVRAGWLSGDWAGQVGNGTFGERDA